MEASLKKGISFAAYIDNRSSKKSRIRILLFLEDNFSYRLTTIKSCQKGIIKYIILSYIFSSSNNLINSALDGLGAEGVTILPLGSIKTNLGIPVILYP